jgi:multidrug resistance efflux pump
MIRRLFLTLLALATIGGAFAVYRLLKRPGGFVVNGIVTTHEVNVSPQIQGRLTQLLVKEGDSVKTGQLLATIDPQELKADQSYYAHAEQGAAAQVQESESALKFQEAQTRDQIRQAEAALAAMEAKHQEARTNFDLAQVNFKRAQALFEKQVYAAQNLDQARSSRDAAQSEMESMQKQVDAQRAALALAHSNEEQITIRLKQVLTGRRQLAAAGAQAQKARVRLDYSEIRAPIDGVVAVLAARQGEMVGASQPVLTLINPDDLWVRADVEETYVDRIRMGDTLTFRLPSGAELSGKVFYRGADADYATQRDVSDIKRDIRTFEIRLRVNNSDRRLWPGLTAYVQLTPELLGVTP